MNLAPTGFKAMERKDLQRLCVQKGFKALMAQPNGMVAALEASMCSDMAATGGGSAAENGGGGMALDFKSMNHKVLQRLCRSDTEKLKANGTSVPAEYGCCTGGV